MVLFVWWEVPISMRVEWRCASTTSGGLYVMISGTPLMLLWSANSWDMHTLEVSSTVITTRNYNNPFHLIHSTAGLAYSNAHFGAGTGPIFLDDVQCTSSASQLLECSSRPILTHNCQHSADAGVGCEGIIIIYRLWSGQ